MLYYSYFMQITNLLLPPLTDFRTTIFPDLFTTVKTVIYVKFLYQKIRLNLILHLPTMGLLLWKDSCALLSPPEYNMF